MNHTITPQSHLAPLLPSLQSLATAWVPSLADRLVTCERFELEDGVLRACGYAWPIGDEAAAPLHAEIARLDAEKKATDAAAAANAAISDETLTNRIIWRRREEQEKGTELAYSTNCKATVATLSDSLFGHIKACYGRQDELIKTLAATSEKDRKAFVATVDKFWP